MAVQTLRFLNSRTRWLVFALLVVISLYLLAFAPVRTYIDQRQQLNAAQEQYELIAAANRQLEERAAELRTDGEIARLAREQYELAPPGAQVYAVMPPSPEATQAAEAARRSPEPSGWAKFVEAVKFWN